jgi:ribosomal protein L24
MKKGDKVKVISGSYKGCIGTVVGFQWLPNGVCCVTVQPNEHADDRVFYKKELKVIK